MELVISLGYSIPTSTLEKIGVERLRISLSGNDLFTLSNIKDGLDPEAQGNSVTGRIIPFSSTLLLGFEINF